MDFDIAQLKKGKQKRQARGTSEDRKHSSPSKTIKKRKPQPTPSTSIDIFGLSRGVTESEPRVISSFFVNRVANGNERRTAELEGEYLIDLKVYRTSDIAGVDSLDAWRKALLRIKLQAREDTDQWSSLQRFVRHVNNVFEEDPKFYKDSK